jgi:hypothetical protein
MLAPPSAPGDPWTETILADFPPANGYRSSRKPRDRRGGTIFGVTSGSENTGSQSMS